LNAQTPIKQIRHDIKILKAGGFLKKKTAKIKRATELPQRTTGEIFKAGAQRIPREYRIDAAMTGLLIISR
jgi:hypothetical protein